MSEGCSRFGLAKGGETCRDSGRCSVIYFLPAGGSRRPVKWELSYLVHGVNPILRELLREEETLHRYL